MLYRKGCIDNSENKIDRRSLVRRHNPSINKFDKYSSLTVGNGEFAFTVDATGLQTFPEYYMEGVPLGTMSNWGWHTEPNPNGYSVEKFPLTYYESHGRKIGYPYTPWLDTLTDEVKWLRGNPHRLHLGMIKFCLQNERGELAAPQDLTETRQNLDLWTGIITSRFKFMGEEVFVRTCCHPVLDMFSVQVESRLLYRDQLQIVLHFPYGSSKKEGTDWTQPDRHRTEVVKEKIDYMAFRRILDNDEYYVSVQWSPDGFLSREDKHLFVLHSTKSSGWLSCQCCFSSKNSSLLLPTHQETEEACTKHWEDFWNGGGAIELYESIDPRAKELERRIVLSQYLTAIQSGGSLPPQESGLIHNSWSGKFHLEMHWWHSAHFALWGRPKMLEKSLDWYLSIMDKARALAARQGYQGARWPKCTGPEGINAPCYIEPFLIWQQPHPIYYVDLLYRINKDRHILDKYQDLVFETAEFMASFATWVEDRKEYYLGPPVAPSQEVYPHATTFNPTFEIAYWAYGLETAQRWREELGMEKNEKWDHVLNHLPPLPVADGVYVAAETAPDTFTNPAYIVDHPTMLASLGILSGRLVDMETMRRTFQKVLEVWDFKRTWGWDYPMMAMTAARMGDPGKAVEMLLLDTQKNRYLPSGICYQSDELPVYLPGNGGLLIAIAMMAAGWDNGPKIHAPGFPQDGRWCVRYEGLFPMP